MDDASDHALQAFKTAWFSKRARKAGIDDRELYAAVQAVANGQADDLGGGVFKKRLDRNRHRGILLAKGRKFWVFVFLFAKKDRANIAPDELLAFRALADLYADKTVEQIEAEIRSGELVEIVSG